MPCHALADGEQRTHGERPKPGPASFPLSRDGLALIPPRRPYARRHGMTIVLQAKVNCSKQQRVHTVELNPHTSYTGAMSYEHAPCASRTRL